MLGRGEPARKLAPLLFLSAELGQMRLCIAAATNSPMNQSSQIRASAFAPGSRGREMKLLWPLPALSDFHYPACARRLTAGRQYLLAAQAQLRIYASSATVNKRLAVLEVSTMRPAGLEPATCGLGNRRSILSELRAQRYFTGL